VYTPYGGFCLATAEQTRDAKAGLIVGGYRLQRLLGAGAMGRVYLAEHERLGRRAAVKILDGWDAELVSRLFCEARAVAQIGHEHLVDVYDFVADPQRGVVAYIMEYLAGEDLRKALARDKLFAPSRVARIASQVCEGLGAAHAVGVVHRDLKPDNVVLVRRGGDPDFVKLVDFGIAQFAGPVGHRTRAGIALGSAAYMSPEQAEGKRVDGRSDIYALGVVMHELLTGEVPFLGKTSRETLELMHTTKVPSAAGDHGSGQVSEELAQVVARCLAKRPEDRYQTADDLRKALLEAGDLSTDPNDATQMVWAGPAPARSKNSMGRRGEPPVRDRPPAPASGLSTAAVLGMAFSFALGIGVGILILRWPG
jgi:eukaryotic-like serine/threonine-protein kinase